ncbi:MAG TPA: peptidoglycan DD-metalloendopeptidase family protein [Vampirovibrionales bacterium]
MRLIAPISRVTIGDDTFMTGDGILRHVSVELGEDARSSSCRFELADPAMAIAGKYFVVSFKEGGIKVPADLLSAPPPKTPPTVAGTGLKNVPGGIESNMSVDGVGSWLISKTPFIPEDQKAPFWAGIQAIGSELGIDPNFLPIIMMTETGVEGFIDPKQGHGDDGAGCGGLIQFCSWGGAAEVGLSVSTIRGMSAVEQLPLIRQYLSTKGIPQGADLPTTYLSILYPASMDIPRGQDLGIPGDQAPHLYDASGRITKETLEAGLLEKAGVSEFSPSAPALEKASATPPVNDAAKSQTTPPASGEPPPVKDPAPAKPTEVSHKGTEIIVELGFQLDQLISFHFIHTGTSTSGRSPGNTTFDGQCIRWLMSRRTKNSSYQEITLRQLAEIVCQGYGLTLEMEGDGPLYQHLDQSGISDYQLLLREARAIGYRITDDGVVLKMAPWRPNFTGFVLTPGILDKISFTDKAKAEMQGAPTTTSKTSEPDSAAGEQKMAINRLTGKIDQMKVEDTTGVGDGAAATTGAASAPMHGTVQIADGSPDSDPKAPDPPKGEKVTPPTDDPRSENAKTPAPATVSSLAQGSNPFAENTTGLPTQEIGAIDLADGKAEAIAIKDESRRVKGYESTASFKTTPEALTLAPGSIIAIAEECFENDAAKEAFAREWRVARVKHTLQGGAFRTEMDFYTPQQAKPETTAPPTVPGTGLKNNPTATGAAGTEVKGTMPASSGGWIHPMAVDDGNNSCGFYCEYGYTREDSRWHDGLDYGGYGNDEIWSVKDGVVTDRVDDFENGGGRALRIQHTDGTGARYLHLLDILVSAGQSVKQGQVIAIRGGSGNGGLGQQIDGKGYHVHLHFEAFDTSGQSVDPRSVTPDPPLP